MIESRDEFEGYPLDAAWEHFPNGLTVGNTHRMPDYVRARIVTGDKVKCEAYGSVVRWYINDVEQHPDEVSAVRDLGGG